MTGATGEVVRDVQSHFTAHIFLIPPTSAKISFPIPEFRKKNPSLIHTRSFLFASAK